MSAKTQQWKGRIKQAAGSLTGNKKLEREGRADRRAGEAEEQLTRARGKIGEVIDKAADAVKGTLGTGKNSARR
jgi:uncharacterized protein YjbJ (UPF0337 family)